MLRNFLLLFFVSCCLGLNAQNALHPDFERVYENGNWIKMRPNVHVSASSFAGRYGKELGLSASQDLQFFKIEEDQIGFIHHRAQQFHNGYPVDGAMFLLHEKAGRVVQANGRLVKGDFLSDQPSIDASVAVQKALSFLNAPSYLWENPKMEALVKRIKKDPEATFYPQPELVWAAPDYSQDASRYKLTWKMDVYADEPVGEKTVFVDATTGEVWYTLDKCQHTNVPGIAETRYHGTQEIITDSINPTQFVLRDYTRGGGIETYDMNEGTNINNAVDFVDEDNYWDNANAQFNEAATDAHWGAEMTWDYFMQAHNRNSYDDEGSPMISYIHYDKSWFNASWNGMFARFGDGDDNPLTSIDVVSHEFTHGVTGNSAGLIYRNESGALNESFSDIFGNVVEHFALGDESDWLIGKANFTLRSMSNPKAFGDPDTYKGENWVSGTTDNGGVHTNSGIQNYWFYLMVEGGSGINDKGQNYVVDGVGHEKAEAIAYRNLAYYLTPSSNHVDARIGSLLSAEDIYDSCSEEVKQVAKAWHAVGVGAATTSKDLEVVQVFSPFSGCSNSEEAEVTFSFMLNPSGCSFSLESGTPIKLGYRVNGENAVEEELVLTDALEEGGMLTYTFSEGPLLGDPDGYLMDIWVSLGEDENALNDTLFNHLVRRPEVINGERTITFELKNNAISEDSFYMVAGPRATAELDLAFGGPQGLRFARLTGTAIGGPNSIDIPDTPDELFTKNPAFNSRICMCVDLPDFWEKATLEFELQQTWSTVYQNFGVNDPALISGLRVLANEQQIGEVINPTNHNNGPWEHQEFDLSDLIGSSFELCLEGKHFFSESNDPENSMGDKSNIDRLRIWGEYSSATEEFGVVAGLQISPNPSNGRFTVQLPVLNNGLSAILLTNSQGVEVFRKKLEANRKAELFQMDLNNLPAGVYWLTVIGAESQYLEKVIIE